MNPMPESTALPSKQVAGLSRLAADARALLSAQREHLASAGVGYPPGVLEALASLRDSLERLQPALAALEAENYRLQALVETGGVINSSLDLTTVLNHVMDTIVRLTGAERGFLMLKDEQGELQFRIARNMDRGSLDSSAFQVSRTVVDQVAASGEPVMTTNAQADPRFAAQESVVGYNLRSIVCVPLLLRGTVTGVIYVDNRIRTGLFSERERELLAAFANQAAVAIENARQFKQVTELKDLLDSVFESIASGVVTTDVADRITLANRSAEKILSAPGGGLVGQPLGQALPGLDAKLAAVLRQVRAEQRPVTGVEVRPVLPGRGPVDWSLNVSPLIELGPGGQLGQGLAIVVDDQTEKKRLQSKYEVFKRMVPPAVINRLNPESLHLGGTRKEVSIIFADLHGFTSLSETLDPETLIKVLNRYIGTAAEAMLLEEATVDKYIGDAVMAFWNAPDDQPDHPLRALRAALRMRADILALHAEIEPEYRLSFRIAVHLGEAVVGLVGTQDRLDYTIIGDTVNTAKRLQENGMPGKVFLSDSFYERVRELVRVIPLDPLHVKGRMQPVPVFELIDLIC
jgi:class 3 adenylate cyclase/GAF domain-containing protein